MMKPVKKNRFKKTVAIYLAMMILLETLHPLQMYALTSGPTQPEFNAFTPIGTSDMVDLASGDFNYNIPIMDVGGYPINLAYNSGVTMDQEASWVGLGWNLNVGQIERQVRGLPDDFKGDEMTYENEMRDNVTVGTNFNLSPALFGSDVPIELGLGVEYNNYEGISFKPSLGLSYSLAGGVNVGFNLTGSTTDGATVSPSIGISKKMEDGTEKSLNLSGGFSSRQGLQNLSMSAPGFRIGKNKFVQKAQDVLGIGNDMSFSVNNTLNYTPTKRVGYIYLNNTFNATVGGEVNGAEIQVRISGYGSKQKIKDEYKSKKLGAYGYENTQYKNDSEGVLDFNREKEQTVNKNTNALPLTNYTYDIYSVEGQGVSGIFRPYRSQVGYLYNDEVSDFSEDGNFGLEIGLGNLVHVGVKFGGSIIDSKTKKWTSNNNALGNFEESNADSNTPLYEPFAFKSIGELNVDNDAPYLDKMLQNKALRVKLDGGWFNRSAEPFYVAKTPITNSYADHSISKIKRNGRMLRNQTVQKITNQQADGLFVFKNTNAKPHHTAGVKVLQADGTSYVFGQTAYNTTKVEATFDVSGRNQQGDDVEKELITYSYGGNRYYNNGNDNSDHYLNKITTPGYAHSFLMTSILSSDYQDIDNNGPSDKDFGSYTKFEYTKSSNDGYIANYKWRVPYAKDKASYSEGLKTSKRDQRGNYIYGVKELVYVKTIETKTHVAFIDLQDRKDAMGVTDEHGGMGNEAMKCIKTIRLYSKPELLSAGYTIAQASNSNNAITIQPIKTAHFEYDYSLCKKIPSSSTYNPSNNNPDFNQGKLTLKKLYFTYRASNMGKFTPYVFNYSEENPDYSMKENDVWGNYKKKEGVLTNTEFPFVEQDPTKANLYTSAWVLKSIQLPSGGEINITTESDDYKYVQNKKAMQMFKVIGAGENATPSTNQTLYNGWSEHAKFLYVKVDAVNLTAQEFMNRYLAENLNNPIYFKFLLNMTGDSSDYVSGYFEIDQKKISTMSVNSAGEVAIPLSSLRKEGGISGGSDVNPISKAGWGFGRTHLNRSVYGFGDEVNKTFTAIVKELVSSIASMTEIFMGPNGYLERKGCAKWFDTEHSWIRLENSNGRKLGGGLRVKKIELSDNWDVMNSVADNSIYKELYGQEYSYNLTDGSSSGVATFESNASPENPFVLPFYGKDGNYKDRISAPKENNYVEMPFGESFFPSPKITYSKVTVSNLNKNDQNVNGNKVLRKHATGTVETEFYTSKDFPTKVDYTALHLIYDNTKSPLLQMLKVSAYDFLTASQGFSIETNDMNGKIKSESVYPEGETKAISKVKYNYNLDSAGNLSNELTTIDSKGLTRKKTIGVTYDLINDFNQSRSNTITYGGDGNAAAFLIGCIPGVVPAIIAKFGFHSSVMRTATTTKVMHRSGVLVEKVAYDLGSRVSTKNLAWDAMSGQVILTETINEFNDSYYNFNYPAYWHYQAMGMAYGNIDLQGNLIESIQSGGSYFNIDGESNISKYFKIGDEIVLGDGITKLWVTGYNGANSHIQLMDRNGALITHQNLPANLNFKVVRSGYRNQQLASMASITTMMNPINKHDVLGHLDDISGETFGYDSGQRVINASAVKYSDDWKSQCENDLPNEAGYINAIPGVTANPYLYNTKGNWRAIESYAYLTARNNFTTTNRRKAGCFSKFNPFYRITGMGWLINDEGWTSASQVTKYSPYGVELENKDALERYSSAQYGYNYKLPVAVASNAQYKEIGFDGFEDYTNPVVPSALKPHFGFSQGLNSNVVVSNEKSHSGNSSLAVRPGTKATFKRKIGGCKENATSSGCQANVTATPSLRTICSGGSTGIALTSTTAGTTFTWTVTQTGVSGTSAGSGNSIAQVLTASGPVNGTATYTVVPKLGNCTGTPITVTITVLKKISVTYTSSSVQNNQRTNIVLTSNTPGTTYSWTVNPFNVHGATVASGLSPIRQKLTITNRFILVHYVDYIITPHVNSCSGTPFTVRVQVR